VVAAPTVRHSLAPAARPMMGGADLSVVAKKGRVFFYSLFYFWLSRTKVLLLFFFFYGLYLNFQ
jgi:hypothetical protein